MKEALSTESSSLRSNFPRQRKSSPTSSRFKLGLTNQRLYEFIVDNLQESIPGLLSELNNILLEMSLLQAQARSNSIEIPDVNIDADSATQIARCLRRDWMNARASLVDNWRQIEFFADDLESEFDLILEGDISNTGDNPFNLDYRTGSLRGGFQFDAPIVRVAERNEYRQALIAYRQTRSRFYQFEDEISRNLREIVRTLNRDKVLFELNRRTVQVQIEQIELNRLSLEEPVAVAAGNARLGTSTARNLTDAIIGLNGAQDSFLGTWVEYEVLRRNLDFDMGTMQLDQSGNWIDPGEIDATIGLRAAAAMGIELDCQFCDPNLFATSTGMIEQIGENDLPLESPAESLQTIEPPVPSDFSPTIPEQSPGQDRLNPTESLPPLDKTGYFDPVPAILDKETSAQQWTSEFQNNDTPAVTERQQSNSIQQQVDRTWTKPDRLIHRTSSWASQ